MDFAQQNMPHIYGALDRMRQRSPERFREKLAHHAPRLRHLRRIFQESPRIGEIIRKHAENEFKLGRAAHELRALPPDSPARESAVQDVRQRVAESVRLEIEALNTFADDLEQRRAERIAGRVAELVKGTIDRPQLPEKLRALLDEYRDAENVERQGAARAKIEQAVTRFVDGEIQALRARSADLQARAEQVVDERVTQLLEAPERHRDRPPPHGRRGKE